MNEEKINDVVVGFFREKELMKDISLDEDFFDLGVSSLTIVELQIVIEKALNIAVPTSKLMASPTIQEWIDVYIQKARDEDAMETEASA